MALRGIKNRESGKWKRLALFFVLLVVFAVLLNSVNNVYKKKKEAEDTLARMKNQIAELQNRGQTLEDSINKINTKEGIEFELRKKLNVASVGEKVAIIVEKPEDTSTGTSEISPWQKLKNLFLDLFK